MGARGFHMSYFNGHNTLPNLERATKWFEFQIRDHFPNSSPFYMHLSEICLQDDELLEIASHAPEFQPLPLLFFGAVQYLLFQDKNYVLSQQYPSISGNKENRVSPYLFKQFCIENRDAIIDILHARRVQTNSVNRSAILITLLAHVWKKHHKSLSLLDIGCSAGLNLLFDKFEYKLNDYRFGNSSVKIESKFEGKIELPDTLPEISGRVGVDLNPLYYANDDDMLWLKALIWADQLERFERADAAINFTKKTGLDIHKGNSVTDFETFVSSIPKEDLPIIISTNTMYQFTPEDRETFLNKLHQYGKERDFVFLQVEGYQSIREKYNVKKIGILLHEWKNGKHDVQYLGETSGHAITVKWNTNGLMCE